MVRSAAAHANAGLAQAVRFEGDRIIVLLTNGNEISAPLTRYPRLLAATPDQRARWEISAFGTAIHWEEIDEDIGVAQLLGVSERELARVAGFDLYD